MLTHEPDYMTTKGCAKCCLTGTTGFLSTHRLCIQTKQIHYPKQRRLIKQHHCVMLSLHGAEPANNVGVTSMWSWPAGIAYCCNTRVLALDAMQSHNRNASQGCRVHVSQHESHNMFCPLQSVAELRQVLSTTNGSLITVEHPVIAKTASS